MPRIFPHSMYFSFYLISNSTAYFGDCVQISEKPFIMSSDGDLLCDWTPQALKGEHQAAGICFVFIYILRRECADEIPRYHDNVPGP